MRATGSVGIVEPDCIRRPDRQAVKTLFPRLALRRFHRKDRNTCFCPSDLSG